MKYLSLFCAFLILTSCDYIKFHQSRYPELQRKITATSGALGYETIGHIDDNSTIVFGRLKVIDKGGNKDMNQEGRDITRLCKLVGFSNKYYRLSGSGPLPSNPKDDSLFFNTRPASNVHIETGLFGVHMTEGYVGIHHERQNHYGGTVECKKRNRTAELQFKSRVPAKYTKTYIGDITVTFYRGEAFEFKVEDNMEQTYADLIRVVPSAANENVKLEEAIAKKF